ncbi:type II toxin-antitoxin system VapC family toxin [Streptomyces sp. B6B3]|uniref:type II toxin-antitoxin system VapC family toxin n=1 Tax=Streptomyces sp. B6B3 TaxID=3153570 RepID=UPI00325D6FF9
MRLLLDTHVVLWWLTSSPDLPEPVREAIGAEDLAFVSVASVWEAGLKQSLGKLPAPQNVAARIAESGFQVAPITAAHAIEASDLPWHHRDPFDRIIIAQARVEGLTLVTQDRFMAKYDVPLLSV